MGSIRFLPESDKQNCRPPLGTFPKPHYTAPCLANSLPLCDCASGRFYSLPPASSSSGAVPRDFFRKLFGSLGILLYCLPYTALIIWLLMVTTGLQVEWRGGFP